MSILLMIQQRHLLGQFLIMMGQVNMVWKFLLMECRKIIFNHLVLLMLQGSQAELMIAIADAAEAAEIREIRYFTQRSVFTRRILEKMGVGKLEDELMQIGSAREEDLPTDLEQELRNQLTGLRERVSDYVQQQFLLHGDVSGEQLREQVFKTMNMAQIDRSYLHEVHSLVRRMAKKLANLHSRRKKNFRRGKLDIRKTLRENWVNQGVLFNLSWAYKKLDVEDLYVLLTLEENSSSRTSRLLVNEEVGLLLKQIQQQQKLRLQLLGELRQ